MSSGILNISYISATISGLEEQCFTLLIEGYWNIRPQITLDFEENDITKALLSSMRSNDNAKSWQIGITREHYLDEEGIVADESARIDFRFSQWADSSEWEYFAEAKNLVETDCERSKKGKKGNPIKLRAKGLHTRYIGTGINHYKNGYYPTNGCLIGYILQGSEQGVVNKINENLSLENRNLEHIKPLVYKVGTWDKFYYSIHKSNKAIKHLMFNFSSSSS